MVPADPTRKAMSYTHGTLEVLLGVWDWEGSRLWSARMCCFRTARVICLGKSSALTGFACSPSWLVDIRSVGIRGFRNVICGWFFVTHAFTMRPCPCPWNLSDAIRRPDQLELSSGRSSTQSPRRLYDKKSSSQWCSDAYVLTFCARTSCITRSILPLLRSAGVIYKSHSSHIVTIFYFISLTSY